MSVETGIYKLLAASAPVSALAGGRIYPLMIPEGAAFPAIVYQRISTVRDNTLSSGAELPHARFQISCWAQNFVDAASLEAAVREVLAGFAGLADDTRIQASMVADTRDTWDYEISTVGLFRRDIDFEIWYAE